MFLLYSVSWLQHLRLFREVSNLLLLFHSCERCFKQPRKKSFHIFMSSWMLFSFMAGLWLWPPGRPLRVQVCSGVRRILPLLLHWKSPQSASQTKTRSKFSKSGIYANPVIWLTEDTDNDMSTWEHIQRVKSNGMQNLIFYPNNIFFNGIGKS